MKKFKGTQGKWSIGMIGNVQDETGRFICESDGNGFSIEENISNNKLIAAAPEMLDLLQTIENDENQIPEWLWNKIQSVIKKAIE